MHLPLQANLHDLKSLTSCITFVVSLSYLLIASLHCECRCCQRLLKLESSSAALTVTPAPDSSEFSAGPSFHTRPVDTLPREHHVEMSSHCKQLCAPVLMLAIMWGDMF